MDVTSLLEHAPAALAAVAALLGAAWAVLKLVAPLTKSTADDEFIAEHGDTVEDAIDAVEEASKK
jgi:hypothetical protein